MGANCLPHVPYLRERHRVVAALHSLAYDAGERQVDAHDPSLDQIKQALRQALNPEDQPLFDLFVDPMTEDGSRIAEMEGVIRAITTEMQRAREFDSPGLHEVTPQINRIDVPVRLLHGKSDRLIPYTETLHLEEILRSRAPDLSVRVLGLFGHSGGDARPGLLRRATENLQFLEALSLVFRMA
jgi:pimeloyl-ACP methyl ester carboxylesterase